MKSNNYNNNDHNTSDQEKIIYESNTIIGQNNDLLINTEENQSNIFIEKDNYDNISNNEHCENVQEIIHHIEQQTQYNETNVCNIQTFNVEQSYDNNDHLMEINLNSQQQQDQCLNYSIMSQCSIIPNPINNSNINNNNDNTVKQLTTTENQPNSEINIIIEPVNNHSVSQTDETTTSTSDQCEEVGIYKKKYIYINLSGLACLSLY